MEAEDQLKPCAVDCEEVEGDLHHFGDWGWGKRSLSGHMLTIEPRGFPAELGLS